MKKLFPLVFILFAQVSVAQQKRLDSLLAVNNSYQIKDSQKVVYLIEIFRQYTRMNDMANVELYGNKAIAIASTLPQMRSLTKVYERLGLSYHGKLMYAKAIDNYNKGIELASSVNNKESIAGFYVNLSALYASIPDYGKALEANQLAVSLYNSMGDTEEIANNYMNIGSIYNEIHQPVKAIEYVQKALPVFLADNEQGGYGIASAYRELAVSYRKASDAELRGLGIEPSKRNDIILDHLRKALQAADTRSNASALRAPINSDIAEVYQRMNDPDGALVFFRKALAIMGASPDMEDDKSELYFKLGRFYLENADYSNSRFYLFKSLDLAQKNNLLTEQANALEALSGLYERTTSFDSSLIYYRNYIRVKDAIINQETEKEITRKQLKLDFSIKENEYKLEQQITTSELKQQVLLARQRQQELEINKKNLQLISQEKDLQRLAYLNKQREFVNEQQLHAAVLQKNNLQSRYDKELRDKKIGIQQQQINFDEKVKLFLGFGFLLLIGVASWIYYSKRKTAKLNKIISSQKATLEQLGHVKDKIFSVVSHDMRAPVNSLMSFIDILDNGNLPQAKLELYAKELRRSLGYTSSLMNNLLNWAASQMQGFQPVKEPIIIASLVSEIKESLKQQLTEKSIVLNSNIDPAIVLHADKNMTAAILRNLLSNAIKYSYKDSSVDVKATAINSGWNISVIDAGTGMTEVQLVQFNSNQYQPAESKRGTNNEKGTGLGLLLCKTFTEQMGGTLTAENNDNGTTITIWLLSA